MEKEVLLKIAWYGMLMAVMVSSLPGQVQAQGDELPGWVNDPSEEFDSDRYLMAVGSAPTREGARIQAKSNLAKIFVSKVEVEETYVREFKEQTNKSGETTTEDNSQLITQSDVQSNQKMRNVEIKEVHEADNGTFYALAVMNRMETGRLYMEEIKQNKENISSYLEKAAQTESKLDRLIYRKQALTTAKINEMLRNQRAILTGQAAQLEDSQLSKIQQLYREAKQECTITISAQRVPRQVMSTVSRKLQNEGFTIEKDADSPIIKVNISLKMEEADLGREDAEFIQWAFRVEAQNKKNGKWFSTFLAEGREGSSTKSYAKKRVIQAVNEKINDQFSRYINDELLSVQ